MIFEDGTSVEVDNIIYATGTGSKPCFQRIDSNLKLFLGYKISFPFLDSYLNINNEETNEVRLYKWVFPPHHNNL